MEFYLGLREEQPVYDLGAHIPRSACLETTVHLIYLKPPTTTPQDCKPFSQAIPAMPNGHSPTLESRGACSRCFWKALFIAL